MKVTKLIAVVLAAGLLASTGALACNKNRTAINKSDSKAQKIAKLKQRQIAAERGEIKRQ